MPGYGCQVATVVSGAESSHQLLGQVRGTGGPTAGALAGHQGWGLLCCAPAQPPGTLQVLWGHCPGAGRRRGQGRRGRGGPAGRAPSREGPCAQGHGARSPRAGPGRVRLLPRVGTPVPADSPLAAGRRRPVEQCQHLHSARRAGRSGTRAGGSLTSPRLLGRFLQVHEGRPSTTPGCCFLPGFLPDQVESFFQSLLGGRVFG